MHQIVGSNIIEGSGNYKGHDNYLINSGGKEISFTKANLVRERMQELKNKYENEWQKLTSFGKFCYIV